MDEPSVQVCPFISHIFDPVNINILTGAVLKKKSNSHIKSSICRCFRCYKAGCLLCLGLVYIDVDLLNKTKRLPEGLGLCRQ